MNIMFYMYSYRHNYSKHTPELNTDALVFNHYTTIIVLIIYEHDKNVGD